MSGLGGGDACPNCGEPMAADQRYCLNCGHRRGDPRLPFMDAVTFMESMSAPGGAGTPPPPPPSTPSGSNNRWNANAALIAGVATLVLAIGVGFLIGRSGHENGSQAAATPQVIKVEGGGGGGGEGGAAATSTEEESSGGESTGKGSNGKTKSKGKSAIKTEGNKGTAKTAKNTSEGAHGQTEAVENTLHTKEGVQLETEVEVGGKCEKGAAGCSESGEFTGKFFE